MTGPRDKFGSTTRRRLVGVVMAVAVASALTAAPAAAVGIGDPSTPPGGGPTEPLPEIGTGDGSDSGGSRVGQVGGCSVVSSPSYHRTTVSGWAFDRDAVGRALTIRVSVDGRVSATTLTAAMPRRDVDRALGAGAAHGFSGLIPSVSGRHTFCVTAVGAGPGGDAALGCRTVTVR